jgi:hypothetical protein
MARDLWLHDLSALIVAIASPFATFVALDPLFLLRFRFSILLHCLRKPILSLSPEQIELTSELCENT